MPTVRPVNHALDSGDIVIRTQEGAALTSRAEEADDLLRNQCSGANDEGRGLGSGTVPEFEAAQILALK